LEGSNVAEKKEHWIPILVFPVILRQDVNNLSQSSLTELNMLGGSNRVINFKVTATGKKMI
jgi:hypothetical protein